MKDVKKIVYESYSKVVSDTNSIPNMETELSRENGLDSLEIVSLILEIEDALGVSLDIYIKDIRECCNLGDLIGVIENINGLERDN